MVGSCTAPGCINYYSPIRHISYFRFPNPSKYPELHQAWLQAMKIPNFQPSKHSCVCELHFNEEDFDETYKMKKVLMPSDYFKPILKQDAVPKLEIQGRCSKEFEGNETKLHVLRELLGDSYLKWKRTAKIVKTEKVEEDEYSEGVFEFLRVMKKEVNGDEKVYEKDEKIMNVVKNEKIDNEDSEKEKFDITRDFVMKQPLKPLPEALQRIIPSILSVRIKEAPTDTESEENIDTKPKQFTCMGPLPVKFFHCCHYCDFSTYLRINLLNHARTAHCPIKTREIERLPMKIYRHKEPKIYTCSSCDFSTFSRLLFLKHAQKTKEYHLLSQIEVKWFRCELCSYKSRKSVGLENHLLIKHSKGGSLKYRFKCDHCDYTTKKETHLKLHLIRHHDYTEEKSFQCLVCNYRTFSSVLLEEHNQTRHPIRQYKYQCLSCDYYTVHSNLMKKHVLAKHTPDDQVSWFKCTNCFFRTKWKCSLKKHCLKRHGLQIEED